MRNAQEVEQRIIAVENQLRLLTESIKKRLISEKEVIQKLQQIRDKIHVVQDRVSRNT
jgi:bacterioferritin (cytochrome b1)